MRPLKLTISAFGPYAGEEIIDFTRLNGRNVFLVTGVTGAGKTTIFDAISYALFGEASGTSREASSLRSDFADDSMQTYIELEFQVRNKIYKIKRSPEQFLKKKRGDGITKKASQVELILPDGDKPLTKFNEVQETIRDIIGVDKDQFRQIVMLPQGEFRKLLESGSKEREEIFRRIFGTQGFLNIQKKLREAKNNLDYDLKVIRSNRNIYIKNIKLSEEQELISVLDKEDIDTNKVIEILQELEKKDLCVVEELKIEQKSIRDEIKKLDNKLALANENNNKIKKHIDFETQLKKLKAKEDEIKEDNIMLQKGNNALEIKNVEDDVTNAEKELEITKKEFNEAKLKKENYKKILEEATLNLKASKAKEKEREQFRESIIKLIPYEEKLGQYECEKSSITKLNSELDYIKINKESIEEDIRKNKQELESAINQINIGALAEGKFKALEMELKVKENNIKSLLELHNLYTKYFNLRKQYKIQLENLNKQEAIVIKKRNKFQDKELLFRKGQAGILAEDLQEGKPCPVCGATNHPNKSKKLNGVPSESELNKLMKMKEEEETKFNDMLLELKETNTQGKSLLNETIERHIINLKEVLGEEFFDISDSFKKQEYIKKIGSNLREDIEKNESIKCNLQSEINKKKIAEKEKLAKEDLIKELESKLSLLIDSITKKSSQLSGKTELLKSIEKEIPKELRSLTLLKEKISFLRKYLEDSIKELELADKNEKEANNDYLSSKEVEKFKNMEVIKLEKEIKLLKNNLNSIIIEKGFDDFNEYKKYYKSKDQLQKIQEKLNEYNQELRTVEAIYKEISKEIENLKIINVTELENEITRLTIKEEKILESTNIIKNRIDNNSENLKRIKEITEHIMDKEDEFKIIAELESISYGDSGNLKKITFESYILTSYFDEIIDAANIRLDKMSSGRFELKRKESLGKGNRKQGLDLEVLDYHTGRARDVKTLSGGEGFKASLSLALGLADIIQSYAGGISIDTMFVDEGFGTLDMVSLDNAIECLLSLQQGGRLVGIISHVPELKERVEAILEVKAAKEGSKVQFIF